MRRWWPMLLLPFLAGAAVWWSVEHSRRSGPPAPRAKQTDVAAGARPNVLLISLDTLHPDHLGCYGYGRKTSSHLDAFAAQTVRFTNCRAQAPWTLPSHMSLFTSMLPSSNSVDNINQ